MKNIRPTLHDANAQLLKLRAQRRGGRVATAVNPKPGETAVAYADPGQTAVSWQLSNAQLLLASMRKTAVSGQITDYDQKRPFHPKPGETAVFAFNLTAAGRKGDRLTDLVSSEGKADRLSWPTKAAAFQPGEKAVAFAGDPYAKPKPGETAVLPVYKSLGLAILKSGQTAVGRVWWLMRWVDSDGRGSLTKEEIRNALTGETAVFTWRRLRQLLNQGNGRFWDMAPNGRFYIYGPARVGAAVGVERLAGGRVDIPIEYFRGGIAAVRAALYAAFDAARTPQPISRAAKREATGVSERTQRRYDKAAKTAVSSNIAIGKTATAADPHSLAWERGKAGFTLKDVKGVNGRAGAIYEAWRLPNSYRSRFTKRGNGRQKKINNQLCNLVSIGARGNGTIERKFFLNGAAAWSYRNRTKSTVYYPHGRVAGAYFTVYE